MTCSIRDNAEQKIWNMVNIYKGLKRRGGKKKPLKIGILGLKSKFSAMLSSKISCIIWKKNSPSLKRKKIYEKMERKKSMWYIKSLLDLTHIWHPYNHFLPFRLHGWEIKAQDLGQGENGGLSLWPWCLQRPTPTTVCDLRVRTVRWSVIQPYHVYFDRIKIISM